MRRCLAEPLDLELTHSEARLIKTFQGAIRMSPNRANQYHSIQLHRHNPGPGPSTWELRALDGEPFSISVVAIGLLQHAIDAYEDPKPLVPAGLIIASRF